MDSEDEEILLHEMEVKNRLKDDRFVKRHKGEFPVRLYEREEQAYLLRWVCVQARPAEGLHDPAKDPVQPPFHLSFRALRFFKTVQGFYTGCLDLAGRHEHRYKSVYSRWTGFSEQFQDLLREQNALIASREGEDSEDNGADCWKEHEAGTTGALDEFEKRWQLDLNQQVFESLTNAMSETWGCINSHPGPQIQSLCLLDLPPELLDHVMVFARTDGSRRLGSTCRVLRTISTPYIFKTRTLSFGSTKQWPRDAEWDYEEYEEAARRARDLWSTAQEMVLTKLQFLLSRADISASLEALRVLAWRVVPSTPNEPDLFRPLCQQLQHLLFHTPALHTLSLSSISISVELRQHIMNLPNLRTLRLMECTTPELELAGPLPPHLQNDSVRNLTISGRTLDDFGWLDINAHKPSFPPHVALHCALTSEIGA